MPAKGGKTNTKHLLIAAQVLSSVLTPTTGYKISWPMVFTRQDTVTVYDFQ